MNEEDKKYIFEDMKSHIEHLIEQESNKPFTLSQWAIIVFMFTVMFGSILSIIDFFR